MKNREKHPNTDDALKAFEKHNKVCDCGCSFEEWLDKEAPSGLNMAIAGILLGSLFGEIIGAKDKPADNKPADKENKKPSNDGKPTGVECPVCHCKNGEINDGPFIPSFTCPDCGAYVGVGVNEKITKGADSTISLKDFKSFIADLRTKNNAKA